MAIISKKQKFDNFAKTVLELPDPLRSLEDLQKFNNEDLHEMSKAQLWNERRRAEMSLAMLDQDKVIYLTPDGFLVTASDWLQDRLKAIVAELRTISNSKAAGHKSYKATATQGRAAGWI